MLGLPASTEFNKRIPKNKFYENISVSPALKSSFVEQIKAIYWRNKVATTTINLAAGEAVTELEVFELKLNKPVLDENVLRQIDKEIPYHILFLLEYEGKYQAWIGYKEESQGKVGTFKPGKYYHTEWMLLEKFSLKLDGLNMDAVYESLIRQVAGERLQANADTDIKEAVSRDERRRKLQKEIAALEKKIQCERQFNRQVELNTTLKLLNRELDGLC